jgi:hypothetical protein
MMRVVVLSMSMILAVALAVGCGPKAEQAGVLEPGDEPGAVVEVEVEAEDPLPEPGPESTTPELADEDEEMAPPSD